MGGIIWKSFTTAIILIFDVFEPREGGREEERNKKGRNERGEKNKESIENTLKYKRSVEQRIGGRRVAEPGEFATVVSLLNSRPATTHVSLLPSACVLGDERGF